MANGGWQKATMALATLLSGIALGWTATQSAADEKQAAKIATNAAQIATNAENIRTIHYEAEIQRLLMTRIAEKVGAKTTDVPPVRKLREAR